MGMPTGPGASGSAQQAVTESMMPSISSVLNSLCMLMCPLQP